MIYDFLFETVRYVIHDFFFRHTPPTHPKDAPFALYRFFFAILVHAGRRVKERQGG